MDFIEKLLTLYWPQTTLVLLAIGYIIKRILDDKSKRLEINYTIFQQKRLEALQKFITAYSESEQIWRELNLDEVASKSLTAENLGAMIEPILNNIKSSVLELQIYLETKDYTLFEKILANTKAYYFALSQLYLNYESDKSSFHKLQEFRNSNEQYLLDNRNLIKEVNNIVRKTFN
jgi:hypothetical protein